MSSVSISSPTVNINAVAPSTPSVDTNYLQNHSFNFQIDRWPNAVFTVQRAVIPGIALGSSPVPGMLLETQYPGDQLDFQNFSVTFLVQENLDNYLQMYFWILGLGFPSSFNQFNAINNAGVVVDPNVGLLNDASTQRFKSKYNVTSDIMLTIYDAQNNVIATITFINAFPITLSPIELDTTVSVASPITASVDFNYTDIQISAPNSTVISN